jgi:hypothetical protein
MNWLTTSCPYSTLMRSWDTPTIHSLWSSTLPLTWDLGIPILWDFPLIISQPFSPYSTTCSSSAKTIIHILFFRQWVFGSGTKWLSFSNLNSWLHVHSRCVNIVLCLQIRLGLCIRKNGQSERLIKAAMYCDGTWMSNNPSLGRNISERCVGCRILLWGSDIGQ